MDERVLGWVAARAAGGAPRQIAKAEKTFDEAVQIATDRVRDEDAAHSGEDVTGAYWQ
jgi:hypothetical protein